MQKPDMNEEEKKTLLQLFENRQQYCGFCGFGSSFAESVDLTGEKLIAVSSSVWDFRK